MARKISISFKETTKDLELYNYLYELEDKSSEIKILIREALEYRNSEKKNIIKKEMGKEEEGVNILDF